MFVIFYYSLYVAGNTEVLGKVGETPKPKLKRRKYQKDKEGIYGIKQRKQKQKQEKNKL